MAGALETMQDLLKQRRASESRANAAADAAEAGALNALRRPRNTDRAMWLALAEGFGAPGHFGLALGRAAGNANRVLQSADENELDRDMKIAQIQLARAKLMNERADSDYNLGMAAFGIPGKALQAEQDRADLEDLLHGGNGGIPPLPTGRGTVTRPNPFTGPAPRAVPTSRIPASSVPSGAIPGGSGIPSPGLAPRPTSSLGTAVGQNDAPSLQQVAELASQDQPVRLFADGGFADDPLYSPTPMTQAAPPASALAPPAASASQDAGSGGMDKQLYDWAMQVRAAAAQNPGVWARRDRNKLALQQAEKIIDDYRQMQSSTMANELKAVGLKADEAKLEAQRAQLNDPVRVERAKDQLKRLDQVEAGAQSAAKTRQALTETRAARENMGFFNNWGTGSGRWITDMAEHIPGIDTGRGRLENAVGQLSSQIIAAQNTGAISDSERKIFGRQAPGMDMGPASADWAMKAGDAIAARQQEQAKFFRRYYSQFGTLEGADEQWQKFTQDKPILDMAGPDGKPVPTGYLYPERAGQWDTYLRPPDYLVQSGRVAAPKAPQGQGAPAGGITDPQALKALEILRQRGVIQ